MSKLSRRKLPPLQRPLLESLSGARLSLRRPRPDDARAIFAYASNPQVSRFMGWATHRDLEESRTFVEACIHGWLGEEHFSWVIEKGGDLIGMIAVQVKGRNAGVGYVLAPDAWGKGYASEALVLVSEALFQYSPVSAIWALCVTDNSASAKVLEKCGYQREKWLPNYFLCPNLNGEKQDVWRYVRYREQASSL